MRNYYKKLTKLVLVIFFCSLIVAFDSGKTLAQKNIESAIYYEVLHRIKEKPTSILIYVGNQKFTITESTPILSKRAHALLKKKVQVIYDQQNNHVINLFADSRDTPR